MSNNGIKIDQEFKIVLSDANAAKNGYERKVDEVVDTLRNYGELSVFVYIMCQDYWDGSAVDELLEGCIQNKHGDDGLPAFVMYVEPGEDWETEKKSAIDAIQKLRGEFTPDERVERRSRLKR